MIADEPMDDDDNDILEDTIKLFDNKKGNDNMNMVQLNKPVSEI